MIAHFDTDSSRSLINNRLAYVAISRASEDAHIYTNNAETLGAAPCDRRDQDCGSGFHSQNISRFSKQGDGRLASKLRQGMVQRLQGGNNTR